MAPRFSVQSALKEMRDEQREDHRVLSEKVEEGFKATTKAMADHVLEDTTKFGAIDKRLEVVENTRRSARWFAATVIVALVGVVIDFLINHIP